MADRSFDPVEHARAVRANGFWLDKTFDEFLAGTIAATPDKLAIIADRADRDQPRRITYREFGRFIALAAAALREMGVGRGDVVAVQLPNWWEFAVTALACGRIGAIVNPLMPIFRARELSFMLDFAEAKVFITPKSFRGFDHEAMAAELKPQLPKLQHVIVVDGDGPNSFANCLLGGSEQFEAAAAGAAAEIRADELAVIMFTSGTTGSPKAVMHTMNTLMACNFGLAKRFGLTSDDVLLVCSPLGHMTGYAAGMMLGIWLGATIVLQDVWEARRGVNLMATEGVTFTAGASPFLSDICEAVAAGAPRPAQLRSFLCAGAPIPPALIERAARELDLKVCSLWGMTESLASTLTEPSRAAEKSSKTDGRALEGVEVRVVTMAGEPAPLGETGRLLVRGAQMFLGYYKRPDIETFDADGWFDTGDLAYMDDEGYIRINGRIKDVLIRGGENVPVVEIENLLFKHPAVLSAALVGFPDARLGERGCAFVVLRPGQSLDLPTLQAYMAENKVAKQYWPERIEIVGDLPRTPSGKVQKFSLREQAKCFGDAPQSGAA
jgi:cyclohexanecarboxylate-CoA ligase